MIPIPHPNADVSRIGEEGEGFLEVFLIRFWTFSEPDPNPHLNSNLDPTPVNDVFIIIRSEPESAYKSDSAFRIRTRTFPGSRRRERVSYKFWRRSRQRWRGGAFVRGVRFTAAFMPRMRGGNAWTGARRYRSR